MSKWTHITACLSVDTSIIDKRPAMRQRIKEFLKNAPRITGSEGDAEVFINIKRGYNFSTSHDCEHCKYRHTLRHVVHDGIGYPECDAPDDHDCSAKFQTCAVISVQGDLRDRVTSQTRREFSDFLRYIKSDYMIRDYSVNIEGD